MIHEAGREEGGRETALPVLNQGGWEEGGWAKKTRNIGVREGRTRDNLIQLETRPGR